MKEQLDQHPSTPQTAGEYLADKRVAIGPDDPRTTEEVALQFGYPGQLPGVEMTPVGE